MELVGIGHALWRRRALVGLGALAALAAGILVTHRVSISPPGLQGRSTDTAVARARIFADTPRSLLHKARPKGYATAATRVALLGNLLASDRMRAEVARRAGLSAVDLGIVTAYPGAPGSATPLSREAVDAARPTQPQTLTLSLDDPRLPILSMLARAPTPEAAAQLAEAGAGALASLAVEPREGSPRARARNGVGIERLGALTVGHLPSSSGSAKAGMAAVAVFALWCSAVVLADAIVRRRVRGAVSTSGVASSWPA